jgi:hypothetical protein
LAGKKYYTFLLGKITLEKLSNFVDYIDCFILIACPFSDFYNFKTLNKPLVNALDIKLAYDPLYKWDLSYSFDIDFITEKDKTIRAEESIKEQEKLIEDQKFASKITALKLLETDKNQALANVFSVRVLENYDSRKYKGLDIKEQKGEVQKFSIGKTGIPIKYEDIK